MTHRERMLGVMRGERVDVIPFVPRLDLWWLANASRGTLPERYAGMGPDDISRAEGWPCYHMVPNFADVTSEDDILHRAIGLFNFRQSAYGWRFAPDVEVLVEKEGGRQTVTYRTPRGSVRTVGGLTEEARRAGSSLGWVQEHAIKVDQDYGVLAHIFAGIEVFAQPESSAAYRASVGEEGVVAAGGPSLGASPMHLIQKELVDATRFFYEYRDNGARLQELAEAVGLYYDRVLAVLAGSGAAVVPSGANYDDMLTYPPYFEQEILPWLRKASDVLSARGILVATHTDGENQGLMDLIVRSGVDVAESITPSPMTRVPVQEYYARWAGHLTLMGCIPECVLLPETASREEFEGFLDHLFASVAPGDRLILGTADSTPPDADFDRLRRIADRVWTEGRLPLAAGGANPVSAARMERAARRTAPAAAPPSDPRMEQISELVIAGDDQALCRRALDLLEEGVDPGAVLREGMIPAMERIGERFTAGDVFIPEVLLSARAMNEALRVLEPHFAADRRQEGHRVLIGTVAGDMHDIGKNMVAIMLRGVGFSVRDIGINVPAETFVRQVEDFRPRILGLSALLTTTMAEIGNVIRALEKSGLRDRVKVLVGGAPLNDRFARKIGADGYARDAGEAVTVARSLLSRGVPAPGSRSLPGP